MATSAAALFRGFMRKYRSRLLLMLSYIMISCVGESSNEGTLIELNSPDTSRQIVALGSNEWRVLIQVNSGPAQIFFFRNSASQQSVTVTGVRRDEENTISIKWFEILHGHTVEISEQSQAFIADGTTTIDVPHLYTQFDYDSDGVSNLVERSDGTCVWSSTESCVNQGQTDIPTDNALLNGDFSNGIRYWYSDLPAVSETSGEYCVNAPATAKDPWDARIDYSPLSVFIDANSSYNIVFDVRAQTSSEVFVQMAVNIPDTNDFRSLMAESVPVSTAYEDRKSVIYKSTQEAHSEVFIGFTFGNGTDNTYCFDNIKLIREAP